MSEPTGAESRAVFVERASVALVAGSLARIDRAARRSSMNRGEWMRALIRRGLETAERAERRAAAAAPVAAGPAQSPAPVAAAPAPVAAAPAPVAAAPAPVAAAPAPVAAPDPIPAGAPA